MFGVIIKAIHYFLHLSFHWEHFCRLFCCFELWYDRKTGSVRSDQLHYLLLLILFLPWLLWLSVLLCVFCLSWAVFSVVVSEKTPTIPELPLPRSHRDKDEMRSDIRYFLSSSSPPPHPISHQNFFVQVTLISLQANWATPCLLSCWDLVLSGDLWQKKLS